MKLRPAVILWIALAMATLASTGCQSAPKGGAQAPMQARFFLETRPDEAGLPVQLPVSGVTINVGPKPVFFEHDIVNAELARVELGQCVLLQLSPVAARDLYRLSVVAMSRRLVLSLDGTFVGARRIDQAMADGVILVFVELPDTQLAGVVARLKAAAASVAAGAKKSKR